MAIDYVSAIAGRSLCGTFRLLAFSLVASRRRFDNGNIESVTRYCKV